MEKLSCFLSKKDLLKKREKNQIFCFAVDFFEKKATYIAEDEKRPVVDAERLF